MSESGRDRLLQDRFVRDVADGCVLAARVHPGARRDGVLGEHAGALKISLRTPPVDGRANEALVGFVARALGLPKARVVMLSGAARRSKMLRITGRNAAEVEAALRPVIVG